MKIISDQKHLAHQIRVNVDWYDRQAKQQNQGTLSQTWVKYVAKLNSKQWAALQRGSDALSLSIYKRTLRLLSDMEESVLGKTYRSNRSVKSAGHAPEPKRTRSKSPAMSQAKMNMQKVLSGIKRQQARREPSKTDPALDHAKQNLMKVLGKKTSRTERPKRVITMIKAQKRKNRFNVFVNHRYAFPAGINELTKYHLMIGMPISNHLAKVIRESSDVSKMFTRASARIVHHLRTEHEIKTWLKQKYDCSRDKADQVIQRLKNYHLIDDEHYAREYIRAEIISGSKGPMAISRQLKSKDVQDLVIQDATARFYPSDKQLRVAKHLAKDKFNMQPNVPFTRRLRKIKLALVRKGFSYDIAGQAVDECHFQPDHSQQKLLLDKYTRQAFRRYGRRITPNNRYQIDMKIKRYLFRKGFNFDDINQAIETYKNNR